MLHSGGRVDEVELYLSALNNCWSDGDHSKAHSYHIGRYVEIQNQSICSVIQMKLIPLLWVIPRGIPLALLWIISRKTQFQWRSMFPEDSRKTNSRVSEVLMCMCHQWCTNGSCGVTVNHVSCAFCHQRLNLHRWSPVHSLSSPNIHLYVCM